MRKFAEMSRADSCMSKARLSEMTFVLLGRDAAAPVAIMRWVEERIRLGKNTIDDAQIKEAVQCAYFMENERMGRWTEPVTGMDAKTIELPPLKIAEKDYADGLTWHKGANAQDVATVYAEALCRERQLAEALKYLSERDAQVAALQVTAEHSRERADGLLKDKNEARELLQAAVGTKEELGFIVDCNTQDPDMHEEECPAGYKFECGRCEYKHEIEAWLSRHPSPSVPTKEGQDAN